MTQYNVQFQVANNTPQSLTTYSPPLKSGTWSTPLPTLLQANSSTQAVANDSASVVGQPAFTLTFNQTDKAAVDVTWPGGIAKLEDKMPDYDVKIEQVKQGTTLAVTVNVNNK